ncbi:MAG: hypothetical protein U0869_06400 [Chloroflexota bacterium]
MGSRNVARVLAGALLVAGLLGGSVPAVVSAQGSIDCRALDLAPIDEALIRARVASATSDGAGLLRELTAARDGLDAILTTCWAATPPSGSPAPAGSPTATTAPAAGTAESLGAYQLLHPADLRPVQAELLHTVDVGGHAATALTLADSDASGQLLQQQLQAPVEDGFRALSISVGDPLGVLLSTGAFRTSDALPTDPAAALKDLGDRISRATVETGAPIVVTGSRDITFQDGTNGAVISVDFTTNKGDLLARGGFAIRVLPTGDWALGVAVSSDAAFAAIGDQLGSTLASVAKP